MLLNLPLDGIIVHNNSNSKSKLSLMSTASNHTQGGSSAAIINYCQYSIQRAPPSTEGIRRKRKLLVTTGAGKGGLGQMGFQILTADHAK
jgi:hypothetical protein